MTNLREFLSDGNSYGTTETAGRGDYSSGLLFQKVVQSMLRLHRKKVFPMGRNKKIIIDLANECGRRLAKVVLKWCSRVWQLEHNNGRCDCSWVERGGKERSARASVMEGYCGASNEIRLS